MLWSKSGFYEGNPSIIVDTAYRTDSECSIGANPLKYLLKPKTIYCTKLLRQVGIIELKLTKL